jgi:hypothetical protein
MVNAMRKRLLWPLLLAGSMALTASCAGPSDVADSQAPAETAVPHPYLSLDERQQMVPDLYDRFPQFDLLELTVDGEQVYQLAEKAGTVRLLVNADQTEMTVEQGEEALSFPIAGLLPSSTEPGASLFFADVTGDGRSELIYLYSDGGMGAMRTSCRILGLSPLREYPVDDYAATLGNAVDIRPDAILNDETLRCAITLEGEPTVYGLIQVQAGTQLGDCRMSPPESSSAQEITWNDEAGQLEATVGLTVDQSVPGRDLCYVTGVLTYQEETGTFQAVGPYILTVDAPEEDTQ